MSNGELNTSLLINCDELPENVSRNEIMSENKQELFDNETELFRDDCENNENDLPEAFDNQSTNAKNRYIVTFKVVRK